MLSLNINIIFTDAMLHPATLNTRDEQSALAFFHGQSHNGLIKKLMYSRQTSHSQRQYIPSSDRAELETNITANIEKMIIPNLEKLLDNNKLDALQRELLKVIQSNLGQISSSFSTTLSTDYLKLTPQQLQIANYIKEGKTTKEIAQFLGVSHRTIEVHRENIRKKLSLKKRSANLRTHLLCIH